MLAPTTTPLPPAPLPNDSKTVFNNKAFPFVNGLVQFQVEINNLVDWFNTNVNVRQPLIVNTSTFDLPATESGAYVRGQYIGAKTITVLSDEDAPQQDGAIFYISNKAAGNLTIIPASGGITISGNVALETGAAAILQRVSADNWDFIPLGGDFTADLDGIENDILELQTDKAPLANPALTGNPTAPTPAAGNNTTSISTTAYVQSEISNRIQSIENVTALAAFAPVVGRVYWLKEYHAGEGVGGGPVRALAGSPTVDNGDIFASLTPGIYYKRQDPKKTPYDFGYLDGDVDVSVAANACTFAYGECYFDAGKTYNSQYAINAKKLWCNGGVATINATSPTANDRFGSNNSVVVASGALNNPLEGVDVRNLIIDCNQLKYANNAAYLKGTIFYRLKNFYQSGCTVIGCGSYAFWDWDDVGGTTYCSGTRDDCWAIDAAVSFEQVNVRGVTLNNCHAYRSAATLPYALECQFHPYGGSDMQVVYNNCTGIADGPCPTIFLALLECKNVTANDCRFINNWVESGQVAAAIFLSNTDGNYNNFKFKNCYLYSQNSAAIFLDKGQFGSASALFKFIQCEIRGETVGVQFNGVGGIYSFIDCETLGTTAGGSTPFAYFNNATSTRIRVRDGSASAVGSAALSASNLDPSVFSGTVLAPAGFENPAIRQQKRGSTVFINGTTYAYINVNFPFGVIDRSKVVILGSVDAGGADGPTSAGYATPISWNSLETIPGADDFRIYAPTGFAGRTLNWLITEYV